MKYLKNAILNTFNKRGYYDNPFVVLNIIRNSKLLRTRWKNYQRKYEYAKDIDFDTILDCIDIMIEEKNNLEYIL